MAAISSRTLGLALLCLVLFLACPSNCASLYPTGRPSRTIQPTFRPLHISFSILSATRTHMVMPLEVLKVLASRGHRITVLHMAQHLKWLGTDEQRRQTGFRYILSDTDGQSIEGTFNTTVPLLLEKGVAGLDDASRMLFEPLYAPSMRTHQRMVSEDRPDVMMCDLFAHSCIDLADKLGIPFVVTFPGQLGDFGLGDAFDTPNQLTGYGQWWHQQPMWHRFYNTFLTLPYIIYHLGGIEPRMNALRAQFDVAPNTTPLDKWAGRDILFNGNWGWDYAGYLPPTMHLIGPIQPSGMGDLQAASNIEAELRRWLDESDERGIPVVYMALGSIAYLVEKEQQSFVSAFTHCLALPLHSAANYTSARFRVVWQSNAPLAASTRAALPEWVREERWVAQPAVLAHPSVALFITHMGAGSLQEGISVGVPMLGVPFFGDQPSNAMRLQDHGIAVRVDHKTVTADELCRAMRHLTYDSAVRQNIDRIQRIYHLSTGGAAKGADVVERAAYVGTQHLIPYRERRDVSVIVRYNVDVYACGAALVLLVLYGAYRLAAVLVASAVSRAGVGKVKSKML